MQAGCAAASRYIQHNFTGRTGFAREWENIMRIMVIFGAVISIYMDV